MSLLYIKHLKTRRDKKRYLLLQSLLLISLLILLIPVIFSLSEAEIFPNRSNFLWLCHQKLERFLILNGYYPFVCARDLGLFAFLFIGSFFHVIRIRGLLFLIIPLFILEKIIEIAFSFPFSNEFRFISGAGIGLLFAALIQYYSKAYDYKTV